MAKGAQAERDVSRELSLWWSNGEREDLIWRTAGSGARFTARSKQGKNTANSAGDFCFIDSIAKPLFDLLVIENKVGYTSTIDPLSQVDGIKADVLDTWLKKAYLECQQTKRHYPIVIFKRNRKERCVLMPVQLFNDIAQLSGPATFPRMMLLPQRTVILRLSSFFLWCRPNCIQRILYGKEKKSG